MSKSKSLKQERIQEDEKLYDRALKAFGVDLETGKSEKNKYVLGDDLKRADIIVLIDNYPESTLYADNSPVQILGRGVGLKISRYCEPDIEILMDAEQAKALIKGLKKQIKVLRRM